MRSTGHLSFPWLWAAAALFAVSSEALASARLVKSFPTPAGDWHLGTIAVGNLDGGTDLEIVVPYRSAYGWFLDAYKWTGTRLPGFPYSQADYPQINASPTLFDLDGDGKEEILFTCGASVIALRGNGSVLWSSAIDSENYVPDGGYHVQTNGFYWSGTGAWIPRLPGTAVFSSEFMPPIVTDIDGNGVKEVVTAWKIDPDSTSSAQDFNPWINDIWGSGEWGAMSEDWSGGVVFFNATNGARQFVYHLHHLVEAGLALGQADDDVPAEVYVLNDSDSVVCFDKTKPHGFYGRGMLHGQFGKNQRLITGSYQQSVDLYTTDLDGDGHDEVLVPATRLSPLWQPSDTILDDDGAILWRQWQQPVNFAHTHGWLNNACMIPVNPDHDNHIDLLTFAHTPEISYRFWNGVELVDHPGWPKNFAPHLPSPPVMGDVDGDGREEIIIGTYHPSANPSSGSLYVFDLDGAQKQAIPINGGLKHIPALADADGDGSLDVICRALDGMIYIYNFGATSNAAVSWSTHRGNMGRDGNRSMPLLPAGTPLVNRKFAGFHSARLGWKNTATNALGFRLYRAERAAGPFAPLASLPSSATEYTDSGLRNGWQYFYQVAALLGGRIAYSVPVAMTPTLNSNLLANAGFEENDNSHWDKWFTGDIRWNDMIGSTSVVHQGRQSMAVTLRGMPSQSSIKQHNQYGVPDSSIHVVPGTLYSFGGYFRSGGIVPAAQHWLEWNPTITAENTNQPPPYPYPYYFTPYFDPGTAPSDWVYANRTFLMPAGFNTIELRHRFAVAGAATGTVYLDDLFFRALPPTASPAWIPLLRFGSDWRYSVNPPPANWFEADFNDSAWLQGQAKLGCGSGPRGIATLITPGKSAYYFRTRFVVTNSEYSELLLSATCTDNYAGIIYPPTLYLNGAELPTTTLEIVTGQGNDVQYYDLTPFASRLRPGTNTIAVLLRNTWSSWDDVAFDLDLKAIPAPPATAPPRITSLQPEPNMLHLNVTAPAHTFWRLERSAQLRPEVVWEPATNFTVPGSGSATVTDDKPAGSPTRFYRLRSY